MKPALRFATVVGANNMTETSKPGLFLALKVPGTYFPAYAVRDSHP